MSSNQESLNNAISQFINGSPSGLLQVLVAAVERVTFKRIIACPTYPVPVNTAGLSEAVKKLREAMESPDVHIPTFLARLYASVYPLKDRKTAGQFFTADEVAEWALSIAPPFSGDDVCDAGAGTGVFADAIFRTGVPIRSYLGVENNPTLALCAAYTLESIGAPDSFKVWYANFLLLNDAAFISRGLRVPTLVIANPPFVRSHNLVGRTQIRTSLKSGFGVSLSAYSGSGSYFLLRAAQIAGSNRVSTNANGKRRRLLFFLPKESEGAAHARRLRDDLQRMHGWTWHQFKIPNAQTGIDRHPSNALALLFVFEHEGKGVKLRQYQPEPAACLKDLLQVKRGISTGRNEFFVLTDEDVQRRKIPEKRLQPVLPTRISLNSSDFSSGYWNLLRESGRPCWLLALPDGRIKDFETPVQRYLREGIQRGVHATPTAKSLRSWFSIPIPSSPPDVFITYLFRGAPRFILNSARVYHLTNILGGRFVSPNLDTETQKMVIDSVNIQAKRWIDEDKAGREYKGGLRKIEPKELSKLRVDSAMIELINSENGYLPMVTPTLFD